MGISIENEPKSRYQPKRYYLVGNQKYTPPRVFF